MDTPTSQPYTPAPAPMTPPVTSVSPPIIQDPKSSKGGLVVAVIVLLLIGGYLSWAWTADSWPFAPMASVAPSASTSPDSAAGWKTYTNATYGYEVKYPGTFTGEGETQVIIFSSNRGEFSVEVLDGVLDLPGIAQERGIEFSEMPTHTYNGILWYEFGEGDGPLRSTIFASVRDGKSTKVTFPTSGPEESDGPFYTDPASRLQILSTFKFISAGWKTYTNTQYGFQFKYPASWTTERIEIKGPLNGYKYENQPAGTSYSYNAQLGTWSPSGAGSESPQAQVTSNGTKWFLAGIADGLGGAAIALVPKTQSDVMIQISIGWSVCLEEGAATTQPCPPNSNPRQDAEDALKLILSTYKFTR